MSLMRARHEAFGVADVPDNEWYRANGWTEVDPATPTRIEELRENEAREFRAAVSYDPAEHKAEEVVALLTDPDVDDAEKERVRAAEKSGKARKSVLDADA
jgi:hypothetical protein